MVYRHAPGSKDKNMGVGMCLKTGQSGSCRVPEPLGQGKMVVSDDVVETEEFSVILGWTE